MNYSNTNCFGTPLAEDTKCKINHKLVGEFPYFNFSSKCYLEDTKPFKGANRVVLRCSGDALMKAFTPGYMPWFQGIFDFKEFGNCLWSAYDQTSGNKRLVLEVEKQTISNYTILPILIAEGGKDTWHQLEIYYPGDIKKAYFKFDGELVSSGISTNTDAWEDVIRIGYCPASNSSYFLREQVFKGGMCDFRVYKDDELLYHLPLQTYDPANGYYLQDPEDFDVGPYLSKPTIKKYDTSDTSIDLQKAYSSSKNLGYSYNLIYGYKRVTSSPASYYGGKYPIKSNPSIASVVELLVYPGLPAGHNGDPDITIDLSNSGLPPNTLTKIDVKEALKFAPSEYYYCERVMTPDYNIVGKQNIKLYRTPQTGQNKEFLEYCMARNVFIPYEERNHAWKLTQQIYKENNIEYQLHPYIQNGMALWLDGCNNSKYGHYTNVRTWQDLAPLEKNSFHINTPPFKGTFCWTNKGFRKFLDYNYTQVILPNETLYDSNGNLPSKIDACTIEMSFTPLQTFTSSDTGRDLFHLGKIIINSVSSYNLTLKAISNEGNTLRLLVGTGNNTYQVIVLKKQLGDMRFKTYHIAITIGAGASGKITAYLNGTQIYSGNKPRNYSWITTTNGNPNYFEFLHKPGNSNNNHAYFGDVHSVRYYDRELTATEVGWNFQEDRRRYF